MWGEDVYLNAVAILIILGITVGAVFIGVRGCIGRWGCNFYCCNGTKQGDEEKISAEEIDESEAIDETQFSIELETEAPNTATVSNICITKPCIEDGKLYGQSYVNIQTSLTATGKLFTDEKFRPDKYSLSYTGRLRPGVNMGKVRWVRARDLYTNARLVVNGVSRSDVNQGTLGDCWLLAAMSGIADIERCFTICVPPDQAGFGPNYTGAFYFRFWRYGEAVTVVVDDFLPVLDARPLFTWSCDEGEMWPCLLEKAYAKLHGSYWHLKGGNSMAAMVDLTGGFPERFLVHKHDSDHIWKVLKEVCQGPEPYVCAGTNGIQNEKCLGLYGCHSHTVLDVAEDSMQGIPRLVKVRNPWGTDQEWTGDWSKDSRQMHNLGRSRQQSLRTGKGEWWMSYVDFRRYFNNVSVCHFLQNQSRVWTEHSCRGDWSRGQTKQQFLLTLPYSGGTVDVMVALTQVGRRQVRDEMETNLTNLAIKFDIYPVPSAEDGIKPATQARSLTRQNFSSYRARTFHSKLEGGSYVIIPATKRWASKAAFCLRVGAQCEQFELGLRE